MKEVQGSNPPHNFSFQKEFFKYLEIRYYLPNELVSSSINQENKFILVYTRDLSPFMILVLVYGRWDRTLFINHDTDGKRILSVYMTHMTAMKPNLIKIGFIAVM